MYCKAPIQPFINNKLIITPNPVIDQLNLKWNSDYVGGAKLTVMDMSGRRVIDFDINKAGAVYNSLLPVNILKPGTYYLFVRMNNGKSVSSTFIRR